MTDLSPGAPHDIWLVRHGATEWSTSGRHTSHTDLDLTAGGRQAAARLCRSLARPAFARVLCSPLRRARETARLAGFAARAEITPDLHEWDYGEYEGLTTTEIRARDPHWTVWTASCPGGETAADVEERAGRVLRRCRDASGTTLLFGHGHMLRVITAVYLGFTATQGSAFALDPGTVNVLGHEHDYAAMRRWNNPT